ncbi:MAG: aminoacyl-histidine dipeptidase [Bacteroidales bacterium]|nr:aminoacyl-histidine dipeptidase [Bacteroidales bacterium]
MGTLSNLKPENVWQIFEQICSIPHPSKKEHKIIEYVKEFCENLKLKTIIDEVGNVIIKKAPSQGFEDRKGVILQAHLDMVPQKNSDKQHDFEKDPIIPRIENNKVKASGTTLGADNGIGVATALAILADNSIEHGPIEVLLTVDEETGMTGARNLKAGILSGEILINLDSEEHGEIYIGCAGGLDATFFLNYTENKLSDNTSLYNLNITGLKGGHSGVDIHLGRANSNKLLARLLRQLISKYQVKIVRIDGGNLRNAIPREAFSIIAIKNNEIEEIKKTVQYYENIFKNEYQHVEPELKVTFEKSYENILTYIDEKTCQQLINIIHVIPNGVIRMSDAIPGLVETSNNLASIKQNQEKKELIISCLLRSSVDSAKEYLAEVLECIANLAGIKIEFSGGYPGWKPNPNSQILQIAKNVFKKMFSSEPKIMAIHAGLETGIIAGSYPHLDMISIGPTIKYPHSPDEEVDIESVNKFYNFLLEILKNIPKK